LCPQRAEELVSAAVQLAVQQVALQPLCRSNTETVVGILSDGFVNGLDVGALENLLQSVGSRNGSVSDRPAAGRGHQGRARDV
jgi:hypothetical protein